MRRPDRPPSKNIFNLKFIGTFLSPYKRLILASSFFLVFTAGVTLSVGQAVRMLIDRGMSSGSEKELAVTVSVFTGLAFLVSLGTYFRHYFVSMLGELVTTDIRTAVYKKIIHMHPAFFEVNSASEMQSRLTSDITLLQTLIGSSFSMALRNVLSFVGGVIFLFVTNVKLTAVVLVSVPFIMGPILIFGKKQKKLSKETQSKLARIGIYVNESLFNIKTLQSFNHQPHDEKNFTEVSADYLKITRQRIFYRSFLFAASVFFILASVSGMMFIGGYDVMRGLLTPGDLGAFIFYAFMVASSVGALSEILGDLQRAAGATERLMEIYNSENKIISGSQLMAHGPAKVEFVNVNFRYESDTRAEVIRDLSLEIAAGRQYALVGPSGAGKSTLFDLLLRFYDVTGGKILVNGTDIRELNLQQYRSHIAIVPQAPAIFSGSVMHNILYSRPDASEAEAKEAARLAYADEFIEKMPDKYNSFLGENGQRLSGGQKQRIAIARAILKDPAILLLDEATNSLDAESEHKVQSAFQNLMQNRTTLVIAHRLATIMNSENIIVLEDGKITDMGKHGELYERSALYRRFCELQFQLDSSLFR